MEDMIMLACGVLDTEDRGLIGKVFDGIFDLVSPIADEFVGLYESFFDMLSSTPGLFKVMVIILIDVFIMLSLVKMFKG